MGEYVRMNLKEVLDSGRNWFISGQGKASGSCRCGDDFSFSIKWREFLD
jgi:hypothetical protein